MSGLFGIYRTDGAPVDPDWLERMRAAMAYYGPAGGGCLVDGSIGMGHLLQELNPEDACQRQPVAGARGLVASVARLDNRDALLETFGFSAREGEQVSDGLLVSLAFERWGEDLCSRLQGDWALAAWDVRARRLLLARDACGNATLYYHQGRGFVAFASSLKALLALPGVDKRPDRLRLAEVLVAWQHDAERTAYCGFLRLVWAHALAVDAQGQTRLWRHWSLEGRPQLRWSRDEDYVEAFMEAYTRAVQVRLRTLKPVAATLSAGLDSGSVVALAGPLLAAQGRGLSTYTSVPRFRPDGAGSQRLGDEWPLAGATAAMAGGGVRHVALEAAGTGVLQGLDHFLDVHDGPSHAANNHYWLQAIAEAAVGDGAGVVLTGQFGNGSVSWAGLGSPWLALRQGDPRTALRLLREGEPNAWLTLKRLVLKPLLLPALQAWRRLGSPDGLPWRSYSALNPELGRALELEARMAAAGHDATFTAVPLRRLRARFYAPSAGIGMGIWSELGAWHGLTFLDPTTDQALAELLLRFPDDQFRHRGQGRWLLRRGFRDRLPEAVLSGTRKGLQAADLGHRLLDEAPAVRACLEALAACPEAREILDLPLMRRCLEALAARVDPVTTDRASAIVLRGLGVGRFLLR